LTEAADQLGEDHEMILHVGIGGSTDRVEDADQIGFLIRESDMAVA
jgi:hypothetical protein